MNAGRLRHRITFERRVNTREDNGAWAVSWDSPIVAGARLFNVPAEVLTGPGRERLLSGAVHPEHTARIALRWFPGLEADWRILWDGRIYNIASIETDATGRLEYRLFCVAGPSEGE